MPLSRYIPSGVTAFEMAREGVRKEEEQKIRSLAAMAQIAQRQRALAQAAEMMPYEKAAKSARIAKDLRSPPAQQPVRVLNKDGTYSWKTPAEAAGMAAPAPRAVTDRLVKVVGSDGKTRWMKQSEAAGMAAPEGSSLSDEIAKTRLEMAQAEAQRREEKRQAEQAEKDKEARARDYRINYAESLASRLLESSEGAPRRTTGPLAGIARGVEAVGSVVTPGLTGSTATKALQTKENMITTLNDIKERGGGRLSNRDLERIDTTIGLINSGTPEGLEQGISDYFDLLDIYGGKEPRSSRAWESAEAVRSAFKSKKLTRSIAKKLLREQFGME